MIGLTRAARCYPACCDSAHAGNHMQADLAEEQSVKDRAEVRTAMWLFRLHQSCIVSLVAAMLVQAKLAKSTAEADGLRVRVCELLS